MNKMVAGMREPAVSLLKQRPEYITRNQIKDSLMFTNVAVAGTLFNLVVAASSVWSPANRVPILAWALAATIAAITRLLVSWKAAGTGLPDTNLRLAEMALLGPSLINGVVWGAGILGASFILNPAEFAIIAMLAGGMMGAAVMTYGAYPKAAIIYTTSITAGAALAFTVSPNANIGGAFILASYFAVLLRTISRNEANFIARLEIEASLRESSETVQLLLNDYEEQSADWLWTIDAAGLIVEPDNRFAQAAGRDRELLTDVPLNHLFDESRERGILMDHLAGAHPFRDLTLQLTIDGQPHWWTLSASPRKGGGMRGVASDVTAQRRAEAKVSYMAHFDGLTDLANRFTFNETLHRALKRRRRDEQIAVLCLDLDQFKSVNDTLGHPIGDKLLCEVARRLENATRSTDLVARLGGDEFAVLITSAHAQEAAEQCAIRITQAIEQPFILNDMQIMTSTSIGIAVAERQAISGDDLLKRSDLALYSAKSNGRNRFAHYEPGMDVTARERRQLEMDLRAALVHDEFELHYQPLVDVQTGETVSYEALVRWNHPSRGIVMPTDFIPIAEETGLIVQIGEWVIRNATREVALWPQPLRVSVNVSPAQMRSAHLVGTVINAVASAGIEPSRLELEITESVLMHDTDVNIALLHKLHDFGVRVALDDFGTGYSSLNYLRSFPFDKIKIDRCFVDNIHDNSDCQAIVRAVTGLATSLGMTTTAEGVENDDQMTKLRSYGCTEVQGYLFSRPSRPEQFTDLRVADWRTAQMKLPGSVTLLPASDVQRDRRSGGDHSAENALNRKSG